MRSGAWFLIGLSLSGLLLTNCSFLRAQLVSSNTPCEVGPYAVGDAMENKFSVVIVTEGTGAQRKLNDLKEWKKLSLSTLAEAYFLTLQANEHLIQNKLTSELFPLPPQIVNHDETRSAFETGLKRCLGM